MFILVLTGIVFIGTELTLFYFLWRYDARTNAKPGEVHARQPYAGNLLDYRAGGHAVVHRAVSNEHVGGGEDAPAD